MLDKEELDLYNIKWFGYESKEIIFLTWTMLVKYKMQRLLHCLSL